MSSQGSDQLGAEDKFGTRCAAARAFSYAPRDITMPPRPELMDALSVRALG